jgi:hypothetical protein
MHSRNFYGRAFEIFEPDNRSASLGLVVFGLYRAIGLCLVFAACGWFRAVPYVYRATLCNDGCRFDSVDWVGSHP